jgi:hypothetical protein
MSRLPLPKGKRQRLAALLGAIFTATMMVALIVVPSAQAVLPGSPSTFESGNDPTLGLGNMMVDNLPVPPPTPHTDWVSVATTATTTPYVHLADAASSTTDDSFTPGQKQDTTCPTVEGHGNPPKDDFTDVASYTEVNATTGDTYLYGATIRYAANGNASENIELKKGTDGLCPGSATLLKRTAGDKLIAIDYLGGGKAVQFHVLTWVTSGACNVANDTAPCWGATVQTLDPNIAEGGVSTAVIPIASNPISGVRLVAGQFAEFGVNLTDAGIIPAGSCASFSQTVWESRASGSSFVSSTKDITIEDKDINNCASVSVIKRGSDDGSQAGAVFTLYPGSDTSGTAIGSCTVAADGTCSDASFTGLTPGTYTIAETGTPAGYGTDASLPFTFTLAIGETRVLTFTDPALRGALSILKNSTKGGAVAVAGAVFSYTGGSVTDNGAGDEDATIGSVCVSDLLPADYTVNETSPPDGYGGAPVGEADQVVTVVNGTNCTDNLPGAGATATFTNPPLSDIQVNFRDGGSGETNAVISCDNATGDSDTTAADTWDTTETVTGVEAPTTINCTITIDP